MNKVSLENEYQKYSSVGRISPLLWHNKVGVVHSTLFMPYKELEERCLKVPNTEK